MAESKHTPGPWTRSGSEENFGGDVFVYGADRRSIARVFSPFADDGGDTRSATAALIAAAPDLYAALRSMTAKYVALAESGDCGFWNPEDEPAVKNARAALAKVEAPDARS